MFLSGDHSKVKSFRYFGVICDFVVFTKFHRFWAAQSQWHYEVAAADRGARAA